MAESKSIPGAAIIVHEAGDTLKRTITIKVGGVVLNLTGCTIEVFISKVEDGAPLATLTVSNGLIASDFVNGQFKIKWQTAGILKPRQVYYYKAQVTHTDGTIKTYLEDKLKTV